MNFRVILILIFCCVIPLSSICAEKNLEKQPKLNVSYVEHNDAEKGNEQSYVRPLSENIFKQSMRIHEPLHSNKKINKKERPPFDWANKLDMSDVQEEYLNNIYKESRIKRAKIDEQIKELQKQLKEINSDELRKIREILTEKQKKKFDKYEKRLQGKRGHNKAFK